MIGGESGRYTVITLASLDRDLPPATPSSPQSLVRDPSLRNNRVFRYRDYGEATRANSRDVGRRNSVWLTRKTRTSIVYHGRDLVRRPVTVGIILKPVVRACRCVCEECRDWLIVDIRHIGNTDHSHAGLVYPRHDDRNSMKSKVEEVAKKHVVAMYRVLSDNDGFSDTMGSSRDMAQAWEVSCMRRSRFSCMAATPGVADSMRPKFGCRSWYCITLDVQPLVLMYSRG